MKDAALAQLIRSRSVWRTRKDWERDDPDMRAATNLPLSYEPDPLRDIHPPGLYILRGPRRVGKSLEIKRTISRLIASGVDPVGILYCSCDGLSSQDLRRLIVQGGSMARTLGQPLYWFLDEVTAVPGWADVIKDARDQNGSFRDACVVLTGSSARHLEDARKALADRRGGIPDSDRLLLPMGFRDFCYALGDFEDLPDITLRPRDFLTSPAESAVYELEPWLDFLSDAWEIFLTIGGFPRAVGEFIKAGVVSDGFKQALWDVIVGDAIRSQTISHTQVASLLNRLAEGLCSPVSATRISNNVGLSGHKAVEARIDDLVRAFLAWRCHKERRGVPNTGAQKKLYFVDPLIANLVFHRNSSYHEPDISQINEQQVGLALSKSIAFSDPDSFVQADQVMYQRTNTDAEIDFVGHALAVPFECKYTDSSWKREAQTMVAAYGQGVMATRTTLDLTGDIWAVPSAILAWLLST